MHSKAHVNDSSLPLIFLGSNINLEKYIEVCDEHGITIHGIIDADYYGNTTEISGVPVIDTELSFLDPEKLKYYQTNFNFFCATTWVPLTDSVSERNKQKRHRLIDLIKQNQLNCISLVDKQSKVSKFSLVGRGVFLDYLVLLSPNVEVGDFTFIYNGTSIGHDTVIGENCVIQAYSIVMSQCTMGDNVFFGTRVQALKHQTKISSGTFVHEMVYLRRNTLPNEIVSIYSNRLSRAQVK